MQDSQPGGLSADTQVTLLLCGALGFATRSDGPKPLTTVEYNRLAKELLASGQRPSDLLTASPESVARISIPTDRLKGLLARGASLALAVEKWAQRGIRVIGRGDAAYPQRLRTILRGLAPPLLYGAGAWDLINGDAICIVGARDASDAGLSFARRLGDVAAQADLRVISGDARGVDREGMEGTLDAGGCVIGVLTDRLCDAALNKRHRKAISAGRLLLLSPYDPDAKFTVARAMDRNKYMYALSRAAFIVESNVKGGTWSGALENLKYGWVPAFVRADHDIPDGNKKLLELGLHPITTADFAAPQAFRDRVLDSTLGTSKGDDNASTAALTLPLFAEQSEPSSPEADRHESQPAVSKRAASEKAAPGGSVKDEEKRNGPRDELFKLFLSYLRPLLEESPKSDQEVARFFGIETLQAERWLALARESHLIHKLEDTDAYSWLEHRQQAIRMPWRGR